jgi:hypothetical protein
LPGRRLIGRRLAQIGALDDLGADAAQRFGDQSCVVERCRQRALPVGGIADHKGDARFGLLLRQDRRRAHQGKRHHAQGEHGNSTKHGSLSFSREAGRSRS